MCSMNKVEVYAKFSVEGVHQWKDCPIQEMNYLRDVHRHNFGFKVFIDVSSMDLGDNHRMVEFIQLTHILKTYLRDNYWDDTLQLHNFGNMSVENIGNAMLDYLTKEKYNVTSIEVNEDEECGCVITV